MKARRPLLERLLDARSALGWPGLLGLLALLAAALLAWGWVPAQQLQLAELESQADRRWRQLRLQRASQPQSAAPRGPSPAQWLASFQGSSSQQERLLNLLELALHSGVQTARTEHRQSVDAATGLVRLRVSMPVKGSYAQIRQLMGTALLADQGLSLDGLKLRRLATHATEVDGELQWSLWSIDRDAAVKTP